MPRLPRALAVMALVLACLSAPATAFGAKTLSLSAGSFTFEVDSGGTGQGEVVVINDGDEPLKALVYVADVEIDESGEQSYVTPQRQGAALLTTPASWFRIFMPADSRSVGNTPYIELEPGERIPIAFEFSPPAGTAPGDHNTVIFFEMFDFANGQDGSAAQVSGRLGARVALRVSGQVVEKLSLRPFSVPGFKVGTRVPFTFTVNNEGNLNKRIEVDAVVLDRGENEIAGSVVSTDTALYADSSRRFSGTIDLPSSRVGPHTVEVRARYYEEGAELSSELVEQRTIWLLPLWLIVLVGFVAAYALGFLAMRALRSGAPSPRGASRQGRGARPGPAASGEADEPASQARAAHRPRRARDAEADERRRRREERAAQAAAEMRALEREGQGRPADE